jgi:hypothetical protein
MAKKMPKGPVDPSAAAPPPGSVGGVEGAKKVAKKGPKKGVVKKAVPPGPGAPPAGGSGLAQARALYPFQGQDQTELSFQAGEIINLIRCEPGQDWWEGELRGVRGLLPSNYCQKL